MAKGMQKLHTLLVGVVPHGTSQVPSFSSCDFKDDNGEPTPVTIKGVPNASVIESVEHTLREVLSVNPEVYLANFFATDEICLHERTSLFGNFERLKPEMVYYPDGSNESISYKSVCESLGIKNTSVLRNIHTLGHGCRDVLIINFDMSKFNLNDMYGRRIVDSLAELSIVVNDNTFFIEHK